MKKISLMILASLILTLGLSGCQSKDEKVISSKDKKTLVISTFEFIEDMYMKNRFKPFEEKYNVKIVLELCNNHGRLKKLKEKNNNVNVVIFADYYAM